MCLAATPPARRQRSLEKIIEIQMPRIHRRDVSEQPIYRVLAIRSAGNPLMFLAALE